MIRSPASEADIDASEARADIEGLICALGAIRSEMVAAPSANPAGVRDVHPGFRDSAQNLLHYLGLRRHDIRALQFRLAALGLSSLGRAESHVLATVDAVLGVLHRLMGRPQPLPSPEPVVDFAAGQRLLSEHTEALLGPAPTGRSVRIMVTMPTEAADDYPLIGDLLRQGMDCMRINCAHDDATAWGRMIEHLRRAEQLSGKSCKVFMDLAGPKLRTGPIDPGLPVVRIRPKRDAWGRVVAPARIWLTAEETPVAAPSAADACLSVPAEWLEELRTGKRIRLRDARRSRRTWTVVDLTPDGCWAEAQQTTYVVPGTMLRHTRRSARGARGKARVGDLPANEGIITLHADDTLILIRDLTPGRPATHDSTGQVLTPAVIGCSIPEVFDQVQVGNAIWFDDGKIGGVIEHVDTERVLVRITHAAMSGARLRGDKGINLPDSDVRRAALTAEDRQNLPFVAEHADAVALSFAGDVADVEALQQQLARVGHRQPAIVLKIETRRGFENLPAMLLAAMRMPCCGVMIGRGDLAIECGFERLAEVQEEILWVCEAAHVPVIWATQVLESLAKRGTPSRAEITDAAMGDRAECVMLNKGPHVVRAVQVLDDILRRMQSHQAKKSAMLRELHLADKELRTSEK